MQKVIPTILSLIIPGTGQIYNGQYKKGIVMLLLMILPLWGLLNIYSAWDAWKNASGETPNLNFSKPDFSTVSQKFKNMAPVLLAAVAGVLIYGALVLVFLMVFGRGERYDKFSATQTELEKISAAVREWKSKHGTYPAGLNELVQGRPLRKDWLTDEWGNWYEYGIGASGFFLKSYGEDGKANTSDDIVVTGSN